MDLIHGSFSLIKLTLIKKKVHPKNAIEFRNNNNVIRENPESINVRQIYAMADILAEQQKTKQNKTKTFARRN